MRFQILAIGLLMYSSSYGQVLSALHVKTGFVYADQIRVPSIPFDGASKSGISFTLEPRLETFGEANKFHLNLAISYIQKGSRNMVTLTDTSQAGNVTTRNLDYLVSQNYFSLSPTLSFDIKADESRQFFFKIGPRFDFFQGFESGAPPSTDSRTENDFAKINYGATAGLGMISDVKSDRMKFMIEIVGQPDFTVSTIQPLTDQKLTNYAFLFNVGVVIDLIKPKE